MTRVRRGEEEKWSGGEEEGKGRGEEKKRRGLRSPT